MAELSDAVRSGRRAAVWYWYRLNRKAVQKGYMGIQGHPHKGWSVRVSFPRKPYVVSTGRTHWTHKVHMVRDQLIATHDSLPEARMTRYLCGQHTFSAKLMWEATEVCALCIIRYEKRATELI